MTARLEQRNRKRNLVVVRAGDNSLHAGWLNRAYEDRSFNLVVSYYSESAFSSHTAERGVRAVLVKGGKWDGLYHTLSAVSDLDGYRHVWLPDDDIATDGDTIDRMFEIAGNYGLAVCQPSLTHDSYYTHFIFCHCPAFGLRYVNHVEIMVPCLSGSLLRRALPYFRETMSGFGLDYLWCRWPESGPFRAAILDDIAVHHTRPVGSQLRHAIMAAGVSALDEEAAMKARFSLASRIVPLAYAGITADGQAVAGQIAMGWRMLRSWRSDMSSFRDRRLARRKTAQVLKRQLIRRLDLSLLDEREDGVPG
ncbi:glycosyltransferase family 2 protein [Ciceribacter sp. RN22]|uniref:glycosyltransferase family 2 protein n=1 Tax=Ciceribacter sp. RN22 TaxID=2954932 RepID=UPI00209384F1|nr:glycosyltransferase family 2 protein [Ciceribacter sp. RN22]MCO6180919.1 glycosyltransferase family 2 protein [Ciceribacter sp. RN22]